MRTQLVCLSLLLAGLTMSSSGCLLLAVGAGAAGTVAYAEGDLEAEEHHNIDQVYAATKKAAEDLNLHVITGEGGKDELSATLVARDAADKHITIKLQTVAQDVTKVSIRVGTFGSQTKQRLIYSKITENLKAMFPQPAQAPPTASATSPSQVTPNVSSPQAAPTPSDATSQPPAQNPPAPPSSPAPVQTPPDPVVAQPPSQSSPTPPTPQ